VDFNLWQYQRWWKISDHNYIDMRYAEVLLIAAEASSRLSKPATETAGI